MPWDSITYACFTLAFLWVPTYSHVSAYFPEKTKCHLLVPTKGVSTKETWRKMIVCGAKSETREDTD